MSQYTKFSPTSNEDRVMNTPKAFEPAGGESIPLASSDSATYASRGETR